MEEPRSDLDSAERLMHISHGLNPSSSSSSPFTTQTTINLILRPSPCPTAIDEPIEFGMSAGTSVITDQQMRALLCSLQEQKMSLSSQSRDNTGVSNDMWEARQTFEEDEPPIMSPYAQRVFGVAPPDDPDFVLFRPPPVRSIDSITWGLLVARCAQYPAIDVKNRLCEMMILLSGEQWYDLWTEEKAMKEVQRLAFGIQVEPWYARDIAERALPMVLNPGLLGRWDGRSAAHILGATRHYKHAL
jgi:hypothetical protein